MGAFATIMAGWVAPITYYQRTSAFPATYASGIAVQAIATIPGSDETQPSGGFYRRFRRSFKIDNDGTLPSQTATIGDKITDSQGVDWTIVHLHRGFLSWNVGCVRFTVGDNQIEWRKVNQTTNVFGDRITDPDTFTLGAVFTCRVEPATNDVLEIFGKRGVKGHYIVYVLTDKLFTYGDLMIQTDANNRKFVIRDWRSREDIQNASMVLVEVLP